MENKDFIFKQLSSMEKVFLDEKPLGKELKNISILKNERLSYQIAYTCIGDVNCDANVFDFNIRIESPISKYIKLRNVGNVPVELSYYKHDCDDDYLRKRPGLYPDSLCDMKNLTIDAIPDLWHSLWVTLDTKGEVPAGNYDINIIFEPGDIKWGYECDNIKIVKTLKVKIIDALLTKQETVVANWFHADSLASVYNVKLYSKKHWELIDRFMKCAIENGVNSIYTPVFSIPLDTCPGLKRPACQLVDIIFENNEYKFNFAKLRQWISIFKKNNGSYLEISHLFSQWGALYTPRIVAKVNGRTKDIFGWNTSATSEEFQKFMDEFMPELINVLKDEEVIDRVYFHISDEPHMNRLKSYMAAKNVVAKYLKEYKIMEACSDPEAYISGAVDYPVVHFPNVDSYIEKGITPFGAYFCASTGKDGYCNRFIDMPSYRNRTIGILLFKYNINCLLHFAFNYYFKRMKPGGTSEVVNPIFATDAGNAIQAGNGFVVYPSLDGNPMESIRLNVTYDALQDIRAMKLLESYIGHNEVVKIIEDCAGMEIRMNSYPKNSSYLIKLREEINKKIEEVIK